MYDFNKPLELPEEILGKFAMVVVDPPFITRDVYEKYKVRARCLFSRPAERLLTAPHPPQTTIEALLAPGGKILISTVNENVEMLAELFPGLERRPFQPSIPNLVYQYNLYTSYPSERMMQLNPEIPQ